MDKPCYTVRVALDKETLILFRTLCRLNGRSPPEVLAEIIQKYNVENAHLLDVLMTLTT